MRKDNAKRRIRSNNPEKKAITVILPPSDIWSNSFLHGFHTSICSPNVKFIIETKKNRWLRLIELGTER